ncbi:MAG TPA: translocation/assembly module TamB domain-containing protein [Longimicrobium sp.]|nr:translocation/assembly module TamB domain-containing protein [Longimicrobium sp.]
MARRRRADRVGLLLGGLLVGFVLTLLFIYGYVQRNRNRVVEERVRVALGLPEEAFELESVEEDGSLNIVLRDVAFLDRGRDTIVSAPLARARLIASSLTGDGPYILDQGEIIRPYLRLRQEPDGEWNVFRIVAVEAGGRPVGGAAGDPDAPAARPIVFRGIRIVDGRARVATPYAAPAGEPSARFANLRQPERVRYAGRTYTIRTLTDIDARLAMVRMGGAGGYRVEIASASASVTNPDTRIEALAGWIEDRGDQVVRFDVGTFRTPNSSFDGEGTIRLAGGAPVYDVTLRAHPLDFRDLQGMGFPLPREGTAAFALDIETLPRGRTRWTATDARVAILGSRASGRLTAVTGPGGDPVFSDTRITLEPLRLVDLEALGYADRLPVLGEVTGTIASADAIDPARGGPLNIELTAALRPRDQPGAEASIVSAQGLVRVGRGEEMVRFDGVRVEASPLNLATFASLSPANAGRLRGVIRGGATISGTMSAFRIEGGDLAYTVGSAPVTRLRGISGEVRMDPLRYTLEARADPLALATLTQLFPALPFRAATLTGPIRLSGTDARTEFDVDLTGAAGAFAARGALTFGEVLGFDVSGRVEAFRAGALLTTSTPVEGPVSGTFAARGNAEDFRFDVDLTQGANGRFVLGGSVRRPGGTAAQFDVAGRVENFNIGTLVGRPNLLPSPVTGPVRFSGGGRQPYRFDVDLRGSLGVLDLEGWYAPGAVPRYAVSGQVRGLDASGLPGLAFLPRTQLTAAVAVDGRGTTPETFVGTLALDVAPGSTIGGIPLQAGIARVASDGAVLRVDTLVFALRGARFEGTGALGLTTPAAEGLRFTFTAPDLAALRALLPGADTLPDLAGAIAASGTIGGTVRSPTIAAAGTGRGLKYGQWAANTLGFNAQLARAGTGWTGSARLEGSGVELAVGGQRFETFTLETNFTPGRASFAFAARRDAETDIAASGMLELAGGTVSGALLETLALRIGGMEWTLADRARVAWTPAGGLAVENLLLRRTGGPPAYIAADGVLPPRGLADLRVHVEGVTLAEARRLFPNLPEADGRLLLDAVITGPVEDPQLAIDARIDSLRYGGVTADSLALSARYDDGRMQVNAGIRQGAREVLAAEASVPMRLTLGGIVPGFELLRDAPLTARVRADSLPLGLALQTFPQVRDAQGVAQAAIDVTGTLADPEVRGEATLVNGAMTVVALGARWEQINGRVSLEGETVRLDSLTARTGDRGRAFVNGVVVLDDPTAPRVDLALVTDDFQVVDNRDLAELQADARLRIAGRLPDVVVSGNVRIEDGEIYIPELGEETELDIVAADVGQIGADTISAPGGAAALLAAIQPSNLTVTVGESVWLVSDDARIQIAGELTVDRQAGANLIFGELETRRGVYTLDLGLIERDFEIRQGSVQFYGTPELNPAIDITAAHEVQGGADGDEITVLVHLGGTLQNPSVELTSDTRPPLPQAELASLLLTGRRIGQLAGLPEELAQGVIFEEALGSLITNQLEEQLIRTGLVDYVRVRARSTGSAVGRSGTSFGLDFLGPVSLEFGKEVVDNAFLVLEVANFLSDQPQVGGSFEAELSRTLSVRAAYEPVRRDPLLRNLRDIQRQWTVEARARWEYGHPRERPPEPQRRDPEQPAPAQPSTPTGEPPPRTTTGTPKDGAGSGKDDK